MCQCFFNRISVQQKIVWNMCRCVYCFCVLVFFTQKYSLIITFFYPDTLTVIVLWFFLRNIFWDEIEFFTIVAKCLWILNQITIIVYQFIYLLSCCLVCSNGIGHAHILLLYRQLSKKIIASACLPLTTSVMTCDGAVALTSSTFYIM